MTLLAGKVAVITGGTRGLGLAIARAYAREGATVVVSSRSEAALAKALQSLKEAGARASGLAADVADLEQVKMLAEHAIEQYGKIDIWVNNAGLAGVYGPTELIEPVEFERVTKTNILGTYYGSVVALQHFNAHNPKGKLINMLGRGDRSPAAMQNAYGSSKAWVRNFTLALAKEHKESGIGIYALNPGLMDTDLLRQIDSVQGYEEKLKPLSVIMRLWANPPEVPAEQAVWLASAATDGKTGIEVQFLNKKRQLAGLLKELKRLVTRQPAPDTSLRIHSLPPYEG